MRRVWDNRWLRASLAAVAVAAWPACVTDTGSSDADAPAGETLSLDYVLKDMSGTDVNLADFKGRPLLINVWATWCTPCKAEIPWFVEFADRYRAQNLAIVGISFDDSPDEIRKFAADYKVNYTMLVGKGRDDLFAVLDPESVFPYSWLVRPDGTVAAKALGGRSKDWFETNIKELF